MKRVIVFLLSALFIFLLGACDTASYIEISVPPEKTTYITGETVDFTAGELKYTSGQNIAYIPLTDSGVTVLDYDIETPGVKTITVMYHGLSASFTVTYVENIPDSITLKTKPDRLSYFVGENIITDGGVITVTDNGNTGDINITPDMLSYDNTKKGVSAVRITYGSMNIFFEVVFYPQGAVLIENAEFFEAAAGLDMAKTYALTDDIDLSKTSFGGFAPEQVFRGVFDGMGHTVLLGTRTVLPDRFGGFFGRMENAKVCDLNINAEFTGTSSWIGILAGSASGCIIENVKTYGSVTVTATNSAAAGIVEYLINSTMLNCENNASITTDCSTLKSADTDFIYAAGIACECRGSQIYGCVNNGVITVNNSLSYAYAGGIITYTRYDDKYLPLVVKDCVNNASIILHNFFYAETGGIAGTVYSVGTEKNGMQLLDNCINNGGISLINDTQDYQEAYAGGITGAAYVFYFSEDNFSKCVLDSCANNGKIMPDIPQESEFYNYYTADICAWAYDETCLIIK